MDVDRLCGAFARRCREHGVRVTAPRLAVYRALPEDPSHPTADAIYQRLRGAMPSLSPARVHRVQVGTDRVSSVQYVKFAVGGRVPVALGIDLPHLVEETPLTAVQRRALEEDLAADR
jgi:Ferric uptake regulator family